MELLWPGCGRGLIEGWLTAAERDQARRLGRERYGSNHTPMGGTVEEAEVVAMQVAARQNLRRARERWAASQGLSWWAACRLIREAEGVACDAAS
ncbi:hypothetical protein GCM10009836_68980 [Pseudonocardia ailaonensis]|uniref:Uncharacterized protein n=1 Tax=Pseudonocardia ailaonensis TaxID=367279 RepID=A0ABN2NNU5_9PSEU